MAQHAILITLLIGADEKEANQRVQEIYKKVITPARSFGVDITFYPVHSSFFNEFIENVYGMKISYKLGDAFTRGFRSLYCSGFSSCWNILFRACNNGLCYSRGYCGYTFIKFHN